MRIYKFASIFIICAALAASIFNGRVSAQVIDSSWSDPFQVSNPNASASAPYITADQYGYVHLFWAETGLSQGRDTIKYMRFDGEVWEGPVEIFLSNFNSAVSHMSVTTDLGGRLHLSWIELNAVYYSSAPSYDALNARNWDAPARLPMQATFLEMRVSPNRDLNVVFSQTSIPGQHGIYFQRLISGGFNWDDAVRIDPDRPDNLDPASVNFEVDDRGGFHVVWWYLDLSLLFAASGTWVRYSNSTDGGQTWMTPFSIDVADEDPDELRMPLPSLAVSGSEIHTVYAGDSSVHREHRYSTDYGQTWSVTRQIFGTLMGQARGDGLARDSLGRIHFIGNIRWPTALYYSMFANGEWAPPTMAYLISLNAEAADTGAISAHDIRLAIQNGNILVTAFGDTPGAPNRGLFVMIRRIPDAPALELIPTPTTQPTSTPLPTSTPAPTQVPLTPTPTFMAAPGDVDAPSDQVVNPGTSFFISLASTVAFIGIILLFLRSRRHQNRL